MKSSKLICHSSNLPFACIWSISEILATSLTELPKQAWTALDRRQLRGDRTQVTKPQVSLRLRTEQLLLVSSSREPGAVRQSKQEACSN